MLVRRCSTSQIRVRAESFPERPPKARLSGGPQAAPGRAAGGYLSGHPVAQATGEPCLRGQDWRSHHVGGSGTQDGLMSAILMWPLLALIALGLQCVILYYVIRFAVLAAMRQYDRITDSARGAGRAHKSPWDGPTEI